MTDKRPASPRRQSIVFPLLAIGILLAVLIGAVARQLALPSSPEATPVAAQSRPQASPTSEVAAAPSTPVLGVLPTFTPGPPTVSPTPALQPSQAPQPTQAVAPTLAAPDWEQVYGTLGASGQGTGLLILHTNDSWGYLDPCG